MKSMRIGVGATIVALGVLLVTLLCGCPNATSRGTGVTISGTLTKNDGAIPGLRGYVLVYSSASSGASIRSAGIPGEAASFWARSTAFVTAMAVLPNPSTSTYVIEGVPEGSYDVYVFIDMNGNEPANGTARPESSDPIVSLYSVDVSQDRSIDIANADWAYY